MILNSYRTVIEIFFQYFKFGWLKSFLKLFFSFFLWSSLCQADEKQWPAHQIKSILIQAKALKLTFQNKKSPFYTLKFSKGFSFQVEEGQLKIQSTDFSSKKTWSDFQNKMELSLSGPSLPIEIFASSSKISALDWKSSIFISSFKGDISMQNTKGDSQVDLYQGQVLVKNHKGDLTFKSFQADLNLTTSNGAFDFQINKGKLKIKKSGGQLAFVGNNLKVQINDFNGEVEGFIELGELKASLKPKQMKLSTGVAPVRLHVKGQGAQINAYTKEGQIYAPKYLHKKFEGKSIRVSGRLRSHAKTGHIKVETERGKIYIH